MDFKPIYEIIYTAGSYLPLISVPITISLVTYFDIRYHKKRYNLLRKQVDIMEELKGQRDKTPDIGSRERISHLIEQVGHMSNPDLEKVIEQYNLHIKEPEPIKLKFVWES